MQGEKRNKNKKKKTHEVSSIPLESSPSRAGPGREIDKEINTRRNKGKEKTKKRRQVPPFQRRVSAVRPFLSQMAPFPCPFPFPFQQFPFFRSTRRGKKKLEDEPMRQD